MNREPEQNKHANFQNRYFGRKLKKTMVPEKSWYINNQIEHLLNFSDLSKDSQILEVGCGMGRHTFILAERGFNITTIEPSPFLVEQFRIFNNNRYNIPIYCTTLEEAPLILSEQYDAVIGFFILHHLFNLTHGFFAIRKLLKPGGMITFIEPNPSNLLYYLQITFSPGMSWKAEKNILKIRPRIIARYLSEAGFQGFKQSNFGIFPRTLANTHLGQTIEDALSTYQFLDPIRPFQVFYAQLPYLKS